MRPVALVLVLAALASGCAELYRWPERAATTRAPERAVTPPPADGHYVVKAGDTMYSIAFRYQLDFRELAVWNDIGPDYLILPGQVLRLMPPPATESDDVAGIRTFPSGRPDPGPVPADIPAPASAPAPVVMSGRWQWPTAGRVVREFGSEIVNGTSKGIDIEGALGQQVVAAAPGKVVYSGSALKGYGELIIVKHDDTYLSAYGYNRRRLVAEGDTVKAGQAIAELGLGPERKPVLHFEVREKGKPVDPKKKLPAR